MALGCLMYFTAPADNKVYLCTKEQGLPPVLVSDVWIHQSVERVKALECLMNLSVSAKNKSVSMIKGTRASSCARVCCVE